MLTHSPLRAVVLISGNGSNLQAIINAILNQLLPVQIAAVISNQQSAYGLERAQIANLTTHVVTPKDFNSRQAYDEALTQCVAKYSPDLIVLAGFMRILGDTFLNKFKNKIVNIHPSLLPAYPGLNTFEQVITDQGTEHGCSIHFVNEHLDAGPIIAQAALKVLQNETVNTLKERVHKAEHFLYPTVLKWFANRRIELVSDKILLDEIPLPPNGLRFFLNDS